MPSQNQSTFVYPFLLPIRCVLKTQLIHSQEETRCELGSLHKQETQTGTVSLDGAHYLPKPRNFTGLYYNKAGVGETM